jgi:hypothetical protein
VEARAERDVVIGQFLKAMYGFEELVEIGADPIEPARLMARGTRDLAEGMLNEDSERVDAGRATIAAVQKGIRSGQV